jgi:hypothetical protein
MSMIGSLELPWSTKKLTTVALAGATAAITQATGAG